LFEFLPMAGWENRVKDLDGDFVLLGHTRIQGMRTFGKLTVVNPGSVGLARDQAGVACYATFAHDRVTLKRIPYDVERVVQLFRGAPLAASTIDWLAGVL